MMTVLDTFAGIGGFSLGLERTGGFRTVQFIEIDGYCRRVLSKHWPEVPIHDDITTYEFREGEADVITGGFPCQDISVAGKGAGLAGERSGLWRELVRALRVVRPRYAVFENVAALLGRGLGDCLCDLAEIGYDAEWHCIPASAIGAPHRRDRVWIVAHPTGERCGEKGQPSKRCSEWSASSSEVLGNTIGKGSQRPRYVGKTFGNEITRQLKFAIATDRGKWRVEPNVGRVADGVPRRTYGGLGDDKMDGAETISEGNAISKWAKVSGMQQHKQLAATPSRLQQTRSVRDFMWSMPYQSGSERRSSSNEENEELCSLRNGVHAEPQQEAQNLQPHLSIQVGQAERNEAMAQWIVEPDIPRVAVGIPQRADRLRALGNAVVPQIPELIGRAILTAEAS